MVAMIAGAVLVIVGVLGFVNDPVLGVFEVSVIHNLVHLLTGAALLGAAYVDAGRNARMTLLTIGIIYALVTVLGFALPAVTDSLLLGTTANPAMNGADNLLHALLAVVFISVPLLVKEETTRPMRGRPQM